MRQVLGQIQRSGSPKNKSETSQSRPRRIKTPSSRPMRRRHQEKHSPAVAASPLAVFQAKTAQGSGSAVKMKSTRNGTSTAAIKKSTTAVKSQVRHMPTSTSALVDQSGQRWQTKIPEHVDVIVNAPERAVGLHQDPPKYRCFRTSHEPGRPPSTPPSPPPGIRTPKCLYCNSRARSCKHQVVPR